ncbi:major facilitator transporter [Calothrix sp. NIES-4071]|nr:major facilitator transporter [Calothrix sp. NIES-4071]BAZ55433.1 major facilitator transporter [Calothrix sp. NIES-4105]
MTRTIEIKPKQVMWLQVGALAGMQGAITLCWVIYNLYIPQLLVTIGFNKDFAVGVLIVENLIAVGLEPLMGGLSDNAKRWFVSRFYFVSAGVILSSALFIIIPAVVALLPLSEATRWIFLFVVVGWSFAMAIFRSPATALLGKYASKHDLPLAGSLLTLASGIISAFRPISTNFILSLGAVFSFATGSFVLLGAALMLRYVNPPEERVAEPVERSISEPLSVLFLILGTGFGVAWGSRLLIDVLGKLLKIALGTNNVDGMMFIVSLALAFAALPAGAFASKIGNRQAMVWGSCVISASLLLMLFFGANFILLLLTVGTFSLIMNGAVPFALSLFTPQRAGLGVGTYFAGAALGGSLLSVIFPQLAVIPLIPEAFIGALAFLMAGACVKATA